MAKKILARALMTRPVRQLTAQTPVRDAAAFLLRHGISGAPVVDEHGRWIGVLTQNDLARYVERRILSRPPERTLQSRERVSGLLPLPADEFGRTPVREFMTAGLFTVFPESTLEEVVRTMTSFKVHRVFVIDERKGTLEGIITTMDVLRGIAGMKSKTRSARKSLRV